MSLGFMVLTGLVAVGVCLFLPDDHRTVGTVLVALWALISLLLGFCWWLYPASGFLAAFGITVHLAACVVVLWASRRELPN